MIGLNRGALTRKPITDPIQAKRNRNDAGFKARVALEALKGEKSIQQIAGDFDLHPMQISEWKRKLPEGASLQRWRNQGRGSNRPPLPNLAPHQPTRLAITHGRINIEHGTAIGFLRFHRPRWQKFTDPALI